MTQVTFTSRGHMVRTHEVTNKEHLASQNTEHHEKHRWGAQSLFSL